MLVLTGNAIVKVVLSLRFDFYNPVTTTNPLLIQNQKDLTWN